MGAYRAVFPCYSLPSEVFGDYDGDGAVCLTSRGSQPSAGSYRYHQQFASTKKPIPSDKFREDPLDLLIENLLRQNIF